MSLPPAHIPRVSNPGKLPLGKGVKLSSISIRVLKVFLFFFVLFCFCIWPNVDGLLNCVFTSKLEC